MGFNLDLDFRVHDDIDEAIDYYNTKSNKAALRLYNEIQEAYRILSLNPFFEIRYSDYRCFPIKDFPYMFHFTVNEKENIVQIHALFNTSKDPIAFWL